MSNGAYIRMAEAARIRGVSRQAIEDLVKRGRLRSKVEYGIKVVLLADVESFDKMKVRAGRPKARAA